MAKKIEKKRYLFTYRMGVMNLVSLFLLLLCLGLLLLFYKMGWLQEILENDLRFTHTDGNKWYDLYFFLLLIGMFLWMVLHEIIHGIFYILMGAKFKNITFGMALEKGIFYCKCGEDIDKKNILISVIAPFVLLGVIPFILGILTSSFTLLFLAIINISGCGGDIMVFFFFLGREKSCQFREIGDSTTFLLSTQEDMLQKKFLGVKVNQVIKDGEIIEETKQKVTITKVSKIVLVLLLFVLILSLIQYFF